MNDQSQTPNKTSSETPSETSRAWLAKAEASLMYVVTRPQVVMARGEGVYLWDTEGRRYLDMLGGWAVTCLGHAHPRLAEALAQQAATLINASPALYNEQMIAFAHELTAQSAPLSRVFFCSTGAEANEGAVKLARKWGALHRQGAYEVITCWEGFHGRTLGMMSASGKRAWDGLFEPKVQGFVRVPFNDLDAITQAISPRTCAIMLEPVQGEGGVWPADTEFLRQLRQLCDAQGILLIFDEIQTGLARTGPLFAFQGYGVAPDIMTLGKGIGGGVPLAALLAQERFCVFEGGDQGGTYCAQPLAMVAGRTVLSTLLEEDLSAHVAAMSAYLKAGWQKRLAQRYRLRNFRGKGLLLAFDLPTAQGAELVQRALAHGLLLNAPRPQSIRLMPPLIIQKEEIDELLEMLDRALQDVLE